MNPCLQRANSAAYSMVLAGKPAAAVAEEVRKSAQTCKPQISEEQINTVLELAETHRVPNFRPQNFGAFMKRKFPPKETLIEGVLHTRDQISLTGRRRHGKTTLIANLAAAGAAGLSDYLGYRIARPFTTVIFYLEDDGAEIQAKLDRIGQTAKIDPDRLHLYVRQDFMERRIRISFDDPKFESFILAACESAKPDLIIFDNLGMLIGADYNNATRVHNLMDLVFDLTQKHDAAILIAAHPKKGNKLDAKGEAISLRTDTEKFFEECMGSSHFINSTGSLWGIERDRKAGRCYLLLGAQRATDTESFTLVEKNDSDWLERVDDLAIARETLLNTDQRRKAFELIPTDREFSYIEARNHTKSAMKSNGTFNPWWNDLLRNRLIVEVKPERYKKATGSPATAGAGARSQAPSQPPTAQGQRQPT